MPQSHKGLQVHEAMRVERAVAFSEPSMTPTVSTNQVDHLSNLPALVGAVPIGQTLWHRTEELHHCKLAIILVEEIGSSQYKLSHQIRRLMHQGL